MPDDPDAPRYWMNSGKLRSVVTAYLRGEWLDADQIPIMREYLWQWVKSPVWGPSGELEILRLRTKEIQTRQDIRDVIDAAVELGMDPL